MANKPVGVPALKASAAIAALVTRCNTMGKSLRGLRQTVIIQCILHFAEHGDATHASDLRNGCSKANQRLFDVYVEEFGGMIYNEDAGQYIKNRVDGEAVPVDIQGAINNQWFNFGKVTVVNPKDLGDIRTQLLRVLKTATTDLTEEDMDKLGEIFKVAGQSEAPITQLKMSLCA